MLAVSLNGALGHAGLLLMLAASSLGALSTGFAIVVGNRKGVRQASVYAALILLGALISVLAMQRALETRDYSLAPAARPALGEYAVWFTVILAMLATAGKYFGSFCRATSNALVAPAMSRLSSKTRPRRL